MINNIDMEKSKFLTDLDKNIYLIPLEELENYEFNAEQNKDDNPHVLSDMVNENEVYNHKTVFLFNSRAMYEMPCNVAFGYIIDKEMRESVVKYIYQKRWVDIEPDEVSMISLFLYDLSKKRESKERG